ncbi:MAG: DUF2786 domain-containing protein [Aeromicrobium sp.]
MSTESRRRREARRRTVGRQTHRPPGDDVLRLIEESALIASAVPRAVGPLVERLIEESAGATDRDRDPAVLLVDMILSRITTAWEHGWQPGDLVHATRRRATKPAARWMSLAVLAEAQASRAWDRAPEDWLGQLRGLPSGADVGAGALLATGGRATPGEWVPALVVLDLLRKLPASQRLVPPPSQWDRERPGARPGRVSPPSDEAARLLPRIRALLAKAESTEFPAEAEAFTAKAQDLMTRHAIDEALLTAHAGGTYDVRGVRVLIHHPYAMQKAGLLDVIARANRTRAVWSDFASCATLVGAPTDVQQVEMLFTSTLVQATRAMTRAGQGPEHRGPERTSSFRKAFLSAYATRIGERLAATTAEAASSYGTDLVPVLERQEAAVGEEFDRLFPHVTAAGRRTSFDRRGWDAGTRAADEAVLPAGEVGS